MQSNLPYNSFTDGLWEAAYEHSQQPHTLSKTELDALVNVFEAEATEHQQL